MPVARRQVQPLVRGQLSNCERQSADPSFGHFWIWRYQPSNKKDNPEPNRNCKTSVLRQIHHVRVQMLHAEHYDARSDNRENEEHCTFEDLRPIQERQEDCESNITKHVCDDQSNKSSIMGVADMMKGQEEKCESQNSGHANLARCPLTDRGSPAPQTTVELETSTNTIND